MDIYIQKNGRTLGPFAEPRLRLGVEDGEFSPNDLAQMSGTDSWQPLHSLIHLYGIDPSQLVNPPPSIPIRESRVSSKQIDHEILKSDPLTSAQDKN
jgi:hypothetical protein